MRLIKIILALVFMGSTYSQAAPEKRKEGNFELQKNDGF